MSALSNFFFSILEFIHGSLGISWSWAIIVLTVIIRIVLIPLTWRQIKSMRAMQALQPHIKLLQEKYKDDRELMNQKVMEFYRENKVSPFGSCLPLLLQFPVFIGLFYMLRNQGSVNAYLDAGAFSTVWHAEPVSWLWIEDITRFDLGLLGAYMGSQFVSSWQMGRKSAGQQRTIAYVMPLIIGLFSYIYKWPAGLMLYWVTTNLWSVAQQFVAEKIMPVPEAAQAVLEKDKAKAAKAAKGKASGNKPSGGSKPSGDNKPSGTSATKSQAQKKAGSNRKRSGGRRR